MTDAEIIGRYEDLARRGVEALERLVELIGRSPGMSSPPLYPFGNGRSTPGLSQCEAHQTVGGRMHRCVLGGPHGEGHGNHPHIFEPTR